MKTSITLVESYAERGRKTGRSVIACRNSVGDMYRRALASREVLHRHWKVGTIYHKSMTHGSARILEAGLPQAMACSLPRTVVSQGEIGWRNGGQREGCG